jgi:hypothetical protein
VRAVFQVLENHIAPGEVLHVTDELRQDIRALWRQLPSRCVCVALAPHFEVGWA